MSQDVPQHAKSCGYRVKLTAARPLVDPIQSSMEYRIEPCCQGVLTLRGLLRTPRGDHWLCADILLREEDYAQATDGCGQIHIGAKMNAFSIGLVLAVLCESGAGLWSSGVMCLWGCSSRDVSQVVVVIRDGLCSRVVCFGSFLRACSGRRSGVTCEVVGAPISARRISRVLMLECEGNRHLLNDSERLSLKEESSISYSGWFAYMHNIYMALRKLRSFLYLRVIAGAVEESTLRKELVIPTKVYSSQETVTAYVVSSD